LPKVVATTSVLCDLTRQIAADTVDLTCLLEAGQDPHTYEPTPSDRQAIEDADLVLYGGYGLEPDVVQIIDATKTDAPKIAVYEVAVPTPLMGEAHDHDHDSAEEEYGGEGYSEEAHAEGEHADDAHADDAHTEEDHGGEAVSEAEVPDPHIWHDAENGVAIASVIQQALDQVNPAEASQYASRASQISEELAQLDIWIQTQINTIPPTVRKLVTTHDSFRYYAHAYGLQVEGSLSGISTDKQPSASRLTELVNLVKASGVPTIFPESTTNSQVIEAIARDANVQVAEQPLFVEGPGGEGTVAPTYQAMLVVNTCTIVTALGGECDPKTAPG
jgi:manganese/iron transport system substrate-binding protein